MKSLTLVAGAHYTLNSKRNYALCFWVSTPNVGPQPGFGWLPFAVLHQTVPGYKKNTKDRNSGTAWIFFFNLVLFGAELKWVFEKTCLGYNMY